MRVDAAEEARSAQRNGLSNLGEPATQTTPAARGTGRAVQTDTAMKIDTDLTVYALPICRTLRGKKTSASNS